MVRKFRKKPVVIEAMLWDGCALTNAELFCGERLGHGFYQVADPARGNGWNDGPYSISAKIIKTLEGDMLAQPGDWIIRGVKGELYPCKPDIFEATYEEVDE